MKFNFDEFTLFNIILEGKHLAIRNGSNCHVTHCGLLFAWWLTFRPATVVVLFYDVLVCHARLVVSKVPASQFNIVIAGFIFLFGRKTQINRYIECFSVWTDYAANLVFDAVLDVSSLHGGLLFAWWLTFRPATVVVLFYDVLFALFVGVDVDSVLAKVAQ